MATIPKREIGTEPIDLKSTLVLMDGVTYSGQNVGGRRVYLLCASEDPENPVATTAKFVDPGDSFVLPIAEGENVYAWTRAGQTAVALDKV